jgi:hypothetical protein
LFTVISFFALFNETHFDLLFNAKLFLHIVPPFGQAFQENMSHTLIPNPQLETEFSRPFFQVVIYFALLAFHLHLGPYKYAAHCRTHFFRRQSAAEDECQKFVEDSIQFVYLAIGVSQCSIKLYGKIAAVLLGMLVAIWYNAIAEKGKTDLKYERNSLSKKKPYFSHRQL